MLSFKNASGPTRVVLSERMPEAGMLLLRGCVEVCVVAEYALYLLLAVARQAPFIIRP